MSDGEGSHITLHRKILGDIENRILSGEWGPGHKLPFEVDLAQHYGCSRMTVNKVMTQLSKSGLIERRRKLGSFVAQPQAQSAVLEINDIEAEVRSLGLDYRFELLKRGKRPAKSADLRIVDVAVDTGLLDLSCRHHGGSRVFCIEERLINISAVPEAADIDFSHTPPGRWLLERVPWTSAEHKIHALAAPAATARSLGIDTGAACLVIERRTWSQSRPVTWARLTYPAANHTLIARFTPASR